MKKETANKVEPIQAVARAFTVMEAISKNGSMGLNDLHKLLNVNKASILRLAYTMVECGYLQKNEDTGEYSLTLKAYEIGLKAVSNLDKMSLVTTTLADLSTQTGRIAQFSVEDNNQLLCLQSIGQKDNLFSVYTNLGGRSPMYCTSAGKALLSAYSNTEIIEKWDTFDIQSLTSHTITDVQQLLSDISLIRQRGYALDIEENEYNMFCIGTIIRGQSGKPIGAISLSGSSMTEEDIKNLSVPLLTSASRLSGLMGYITI